MKKIEYQVLAQQAYQAVRGMILTGELKPNEKLVQEDLARELGISRTPILAAFSRLERDMLVVSIPRRGVFVKQFSLPELLNIYDIRLRLEPLGARHAAEHAAPAEVETLSQLATEFVAAVAEGDFRRIKDADHSFHLEVMRLSGNQILYEMIATFNILLIANLKGFQKDPHKSGTEHQMLVAAIRGNDPDEAERVMYEHISESRNAIRGRIAEESHKES
ncbi:MAG TPA: GntR family transcriptional regulator [Spirochaetia bacterium]|nr:GntR family transcriptional regulator [Spirochaetia bacterium]